MKEEIQLEEMLYQIRKNLGLELYHVFVQTEPGSYDIVDSRHNEKQGVLHFGTEKIERA